MSESIAEQRRYTVEEYFRMEYDATEKHDFIDGQIVSMAGGTEAHSLITTNLIAAIKNLLKGKPCRVYDSNLRVAVSRDVRYSYPDLSVVCEATQFDPKDKNKTTITNPRMVVKVLSRSTEATDRGEKFERYLKLASLEEYVLVLQDRPRVETFCRLPDGTWIFAYAHGLDTKLRLRSMSIDLSLAEVYTGVEFPPDQELSQRSDNCD